jgi:hypothetical protein
MGTAGEGLVSSLATVGGALTITLDTGEVVRDLNFLGIMVF